MREVISKKLPFQIKDVQLQNFRGFGNFQLTIDAEDTGHNISALVAENGNGKSTILDIISELLNLFLFDTILEANYVPNIKPSDIRNDSLVANGSIKILAEYYTHNTDILELCSNIIEHICSIEFIVDILSEHSNQIASIKAEFDNTWRLLFTIKDLISFEDSISFEIEPTADISKKLSNIQSKYVNISSIEICEYINSKWVPLFDLIEPTYKRNEIELKFELNKKKFEVTDEFTKFTFNYNNHKATKEQHLPEVSKLKDNLERNIGSLWAYNLSHKFKPQDIVFIYQGDMPITTTHQDLRWKEELSIADVYLNTLNKDRFILSDFNDWLFSLWIDNKNMFESIKEIIIDFLNVNIFNKYTSLFFEKNYLMIKKSTTTSKGGDSEISFEIHKLSTGELHYIGIIGELLMKSSPFIKINSENIKTDLEALSGVVLIDEIDMHLHPQWQSYICEKIENFFPKIHFILSTHSLYVINNIPAKNIYILNDFTSQNAPRSYGQPIEFISDEIMNTRTSVFKEDFSDIYQHISNRKIDKAENLIAEIENKIRKHEPNSNLTNSELIKLKSIIDRIKLLEK